MQVSLKNRMQRRFSLMCFPRNAGVGGGRKCHSGNYYSSHFRYLSRCDPADINRDANLHKYGGKT